MQVLLEALLARLAREPAPAPCQHLATLGALAYNTHALWSPAKPKVFLCSDCAYRIPRGKECDACGEGCRPEVATMRLLPRGSGPAMAVRLCRGCADRMPGTTRPGEIPATVTDPLLDVLKSTWPNMQTCGHTERIDAMGYYWVPQDPRFLRCVSCVPFAPTTVLCAACHTRRLSNRHAVTIGRITLLPHLCPSCATSGPPDQPQAAA